MKAFKKILLVFLCLISISLFLSCNEEKLTEIDTRYTDALKLETNYTDKSFLDNGIGEVSLTQKVDGDTAHFRDLKKGYNFTARFLQINTPESTGRVEAWGRAASIFVADILKEANKIVLESEIVGKKAELDSTGNRYLAYVWYQANEGDDFRLLNLEIVENCYSRYNGDKDDSKYASHFFNANKKSYSVAKGVFGELDPNFDYSLEVTEVTIAYLRNNYEQLSNNGMKFKITARIVRSVGDNLYIEDVEEYTDDETGETYIGGIYMYCGYGLNLGGMAFGTVISFTCKAVDDEVYGIQLTEPREVSELYYDLQPISNVFNGETEFVLQDYEGFVIKLSYAVVVSVGNVGEGSAYTFTVKTKANQLINIRIDKSVSPKLDYNLILELKESQSPISIIGGVSKYSDTYQIMFGNYLNNKNDFVILDK